MAATKMNPKSIAKGAAFVLVILAANAVAESKGFGLKDLLAKVGV